MPGAWGDWDPRALGLIGARVPGYPGHTGYGESLGVPRTPDPAFAVSRVARGPMGVGDLRENLYLDLPLYLCVYTPGVLGPRPQG